MKIGVFIDELIDFSVAESVVAFVTQANRWSELGAEVIALTEKQQFMELKDLTEQLKKTGWAVPRLANAQTVKNFLELALAEKLDLVIEKLGAEKLPAELPPEAEKLRKIVVADWRKLATLPPEPENLMPAE